MLARLFLLFTITTLVEMVLLIQLGKWMGVAPTLALVVITGLVGAWLARREGTRALGAIRQQLAAGQMPTDGLLDGIAVLIAGAFLLTPGVLTDVAGFLLLVPAARAPMKAAIKRQFRSAIERGVASGRVHVQMQGFPGGGFPGGGFPGSGFPGGRSAPAFREGQGAELQPERVPGEAIEGEIVD